MAHAKHEVDVYITIQDKVFVECDLSTDYGDVAAEAEAMALSKWICSDMNLGNISTECDIRSITAENDGGPDRSDEL